jgi:hypothetical protein
VGIEEEALLLDPDNSWSVANRIHDVRDACGLRAASVGTHPTATPPDVALSAGARCQQIAGGQSSSGATG